MKPDAHLPVGSATDDRQIVADFKQYLEAHVATDTFSDATLLAKHGELLFQAAYGLASQSFNVTNQIATKFNLGSMNKMFTAVAVAQLAEAGALRARLAGN